jgi:ribose 5-phosphate isomerase A
VTSSETGDPARKAAAEAALERIEPGMTIGLGSGRAVWAVIDAMARRWPGGPPVRAALASRRTEERARPAGIEVVQLDGTVRLDLAIDGADEVDPDLGLIKGGGAALLRERLVVAAAERFVAVAEESKRVQRLGQTRPLPVEVVRFAWEDTRRRLAELVSPADIRTGDAGEPVKVRTDDVGSPLVTDEGHHLLDCALPAEGDLQALAVAIKATVGVVEHGLFLTEATTVLLGRPDGGVDVLERTP